jgi:hypothetical protein
MTPAAAAAELTPLKSIFPLSPETPAIYPVWDNLVARRSPKKC